jgi:hypothetical protein
MDSGGLKQRKYLVSRTINHPTVISSTSDSTPDAPAATSFLEQMLEYDQEFFTVSPLPGYLFVPVYVQL